MVISEASQALNLKSEGKMTLAMLVTSTENEKAQRFLNGDPEDRLSV